jgi:DNA topoisomerase VI subunit B
MNVSGSQWISSNLSITGFSDDLACFMTMKELVENALDAIGSCERPSIELHIEEVYGFVDITCKDNGCGFRVDSVEALVTVFQSSRLRDSSSTIGKFGVGLKAMALMSHQKCSGHRIRVQSCLPGANSTVSFEMGVGASGEIEIFDATLTQGGENSTSVCVRSPGPPEFSSFVRNMRQYLQELVLARRSLCITLSVNDEDSSVIHPITLENHTFHRDPSNVVEVSISISKDTRLVDSIVRVTRVVNGVPLLASQSCTVAHTCMSTLQKQSSCLGMGFSDEKNFDTIYTKMKLVSSPQGSDWNLLDVRINIIPPPGQTVDYGSLTKDSVVGLVGGSASLSTLVTRSVKACLRKMQSTYSSEFQSVHDYEFTCALKTYIPVIAKNLAQVAVRIRDPRKLMQETFSSEDVETIESKLKTVLTDRLRS